MALTVTKARRAAYPVRVLDIKMLSEDEIESIKDLAFSAATLGHEQLVKHCQSLPSDQRDVARSIWKELEIKAKAADGENGND